MQNTLEGKCCIVTGATSGIGKAVADGLAHHGATLILPCRNMEKANALRREMPGKHVVIIHTDLSSQHSVRSFAHEYQSRFEKLDVLINCAGIANKKKVLTIDGIEETLAVNVLAPFMLNNLLLQDLLRSEQGRAINVSSGLHRRAKTFFDERPYSGLRTYAQTALARILITYEQARKLEQTKVTVNALHPGGIRSNIGKNNSGFLSALYRIYNLFLGTPEKGAETPLYLATSEEVTGISGCYFEKKTPVLSSKYSYDKSLAAECWSSCEKLTGVNLQKIYRCIQ